ncbi:MAG: DUF502 domain-containing protein [Bacteroidetes bacterium]|nr:DUF502 domain-containing protein [Bacteroidota bacterium]MBL0095237.1 DUF502 domain-containing protein [Bacteroidota bacterium]
MKKLANYFFQGLLFVVPAVVTFYVVYMSILWMDNLLPIKVPLAVPGADDIELPGLGILIILAVITFLGYLGTRFVKNPFFLMFESLMEKTPLLKIIYSSVKDLIEAFVGEKKRFNEPVLVTVNSNPSVQRFGFITENDLSRLGLAKEKLAVYLPFSYGFNGQLVVVDATQVQKLDASGTEMMKFVISGGVTEI